VTRVSAEFVCITSISAFAKGRDEELFWIDPAHEVEFAAIRAPSREPATYLTTRHRRLLSGNDVT
jgi:hypothetical protein